MELQALLTYGWCDDASEPLSASLLHESARNSGDYQTGLASALDQALSQTGRAPHIGGLDELFRRCTGGFNAIKQFTGALTQLPASGACPQPLMCRIDGFAYAFLKGAKNFDLFLPPAGTLNAPFREALSNWDTEMYALERFERRGEDLPVSTSVTAAAYLALRSIVTRASARAYSSVAGSRWSPTTAKLFSLRTLKASANSWTW